MGALGIRLLGGREDVLVEALLDALEEVELCQSIVCGQGKANAREKAAPLLVPPDVTSASALCALSLS